MAKITVVEDDATVRGVVVDYLTAAGHEVVQFGNGVDGLAHILSGNTDLVVLDLMLPGLDGLEVFRRTRRAGLDVLVIMLTARGTEADRILGLELGADDYLAKPFSPRELVLRVESVLRRNTQTSEAALVNDGDLLLDVAAQTVSQNGQPLSLTLREYDLLAHLLTNPGKVFSREELMGAVWGWEHGDPSTVTVHVRRLRGKIEPDPANPTRLVTVWGRGYRWDACG